MLCLFGMAMFVYVFSIQTSEPAQAAPDCLEEADMLAEIMGCEGLANACMAYYCDDGNWYYAWEWGPQP